MRLDEEIDEEEVRAGTDFEPLQYAIETLISEASRSRHHRDNNTRGNQDDGQH